MVHADNQYDPALVAQMVKPIEAGIADVVIGSRLLEDEAIAGGMPRWKWIGNRFLTSIENAAFRRGYSECPICVPARRTIMSGQSPAAHGVLTNHNAPFEPGHTLAGELRAAGYQTEMVGKLHLNPARRRFGFDHMALANSPRGRDNDYVEWLAQVGARPPVDRWPMAHGATPNGFIGRPFHLDESLTHTFWCASEATGASNRARSTTSAICIASSASTRRRSRSTSRR